MKSVDAAVFLWVSALAVAVGVHNASRSWDLRVALAVAAIAAFVALTSTSANRCWDSRVIGQGPEELNRVLRAFVVADLLLAFLGLLFRVDPVRPWVFDVVPAIGMGVLGGRYLIRRALHTARRTSACMSTVLGVGTHTTIADLAARARRVPHFGWNVVAACTTSGAYADQAYAIGGTPVVGDLDDVARHVHDLSVDVVAIAPIPGWTPQRLHRLARQLEGTGVEMLVDPGLMEIGGPRLHVAPVDGLPLLRVTEPRFAGATRTVKNAIDRVLPLALLVLLLPVLLVIATLIKRDGGPIFYRHERVGRSGRVFHMVKFRSMVVDADRGVGPLRARSEGSRPLFKIKADPRVTSVGRLLRRLLLEDSPQLFNVLAGSMSLVGPPPPPFREVETDADDARRRLLVRPAVTGLWRVSRPSDPRREELARRDLRDVEKWSPALDPSIRWKTVVAVLEGWGAY